MEFQDTGSEKGGLAGPNATVPAADGEKGLFGYALPLAAPIVSACLLIAAVQVPYVLERGRFEALVFLVLSLAAVNFFAARRMTGSRQFSVPPVMLAVGGFGYLMLVGNASGRYLVIAGVVALLAVFFTFLERRLAVVGDNAEREIPVEYGRLSLMMVAPATFFIYAFLFALIEHQVSRRVFMVMVAAALSSFLSWEAFRKMGTEERPIKPLILGIGLLGSEFFLALSFLPINHLVNAAVLCIMLSLLLQRAKETLIPERDESSFRRQAAFSLFLITLILITAQWL